MLDNQPFLPLSSEHSNGVTEKGRNASLRWPGHPIALNLLVEKRLGSEAEDVEITDYQ